MISRQTIVVLCVAGVAVGGVSLPVVVGVEVSPVTLLPVSFLVLTLMFWGWVRRMSVTVDPPYRVAPETSRSVPVPGATFDQRLIKTQSREAGPDSYTRQRIYDQLESIAESVLTNYGHLEPAEANEQIQRGTWTDNRIAASFLRDEPLVPSLSDRIRELCRPFSYYTRCIDHTVNALVEHTETSQRSQQTQSLLPPTIGRFSSETTTTGTEENVGVDRPSAVDFEFDTQASRLTHHWRGISVLALGGLAFGLIFDSPGLLLASATGVGYTAYSRFQPELQLEVTVDHHFSNTAPKPGEELTVTVTVHNDGETVLSDLRVIDGVPDDLAVVCGSPRYATVLPPNETLAFEYTVRARRGKHPFTPTLVCARPISDTVEVKRAIDTNAEILCRPILDSVLDHSVRKQVTQYIGQVQTDTGGQGLEFHTVRQYRRGDPVNRIDWKQFARSGTLSTIAYREERATEVMIAIDSRETAFIAPSPRDPTACDRSVTGATKLFETLLTAGNRIGLTAFGPEECWIPPTGTRKSGYRIRDVLTKHPAFSHEPPDESCYVSDWIETFRRRISNVTQLILFSPLSDQAAVTVALSLEEYGHPVTVISPDPTSIETIGQRVASLERQLRISKLRRAGVTVVDWPYNRELGVILEQHSNRRGR